MRELDTDYTFHNQSIDRVPPQRTYQPFSHKGESSKGVTYMLTLKQIPLKEMKQSIRDYLSAPPIQGDWDLMNEWIGNMGEALYNPLWLWEKSPKRYGIMHGHHRYRLLTAMDAESVWAYVLTAQHHKIGNLNIPPEKRQVMTLNDRPPINGTVRGVCSSCGVATRWVKKTYDRVSDVRLYCSSCGAENPYPWRGRL